MLLVDKPAGPTSHDVVSAVRRALDIHRVGHAGTLDPPATGLLVVLIGAATRLTRFVSPLPKRYHGTIRFGWETTTDDATGAPATGPDETWRRFTPDVLRQALSEIARRGTQVPPAVSAKQQGGERAYKMARRGEPLDLGPVAVRIDRIEMGEWTGVVPELPIDVECGAGTYIRAIARDLGRQLGSGAHLGELRRTAIGPWDVAAALTLEALTPDAVAAALRPMTEAVAHLPRVTLGSDEARRFKFGQKLTVPALPAASEAAVFDASDLLGVAEIKDGLLCPAVGLAS